MTAPLHPVIRLRPNAAARAVRHGAPWVFDNEIVTDRRTRALPPGTIAVLEDGAAGAGIGDARPAL
jgi:23S rRNA (cytosine1962-C5)-methyltransferase